MEKEEMTKQYYAHSPEGEVGMDSILIRNFPLMQIAFFGFIC